MKIFLRFLRNMRGGAWIPKISALSIAVVHATTYAQPTLSRTWIGEELSYLKIQGNSVLYSDGAIVRNYLCESYGDTLCIWTEYYKGSDTSVYRKIHCFQIVQLSVNSLTLEAISDGASYFLGGKKQATFLDSICIYNPDIAFERLSFAARGCFGECPIVTLSFDSSGYIVLLGEKYTDPYVGLYEGRMTNSVLQKFVEILKRSAIERITENTGEVIDAPYYVLKIIHNGKTKHVEGSNFSYFHSNMLEFLTYLYKRVQLEKRTKSYFFGVGGR